MQLSILDEQINNLNALNRTSAKALDTFADTSNAIAVRARQITLDIKPWEVAQENITLTIEEMAKASRCYHAPPSLSMVLARKEKRPELVARCIDYLVYTSDYLASHPPNDYADVIQAQTDQQLESIVDIAEDLVKTSFISALQKSATSTATATGGGAAAGARSGKFPPALSSTREKGGGCALRRGGALIRNPDALRDIDMVIQRLGENFNRLDVLQDDVVKMLEKRIMSLVNSQFDSTYMEEETGKAQTSSHAQPGLLKHYQRDSHRLLKISKYARQLVQEMAECLNTYVLVPLQEDYAVVEIPATLCMLVCQVIIERAFRAIEFDYAVFNDPTMMFIESRGQGIGMYPAKARYFRDIVFVGLNLIEDLWSWKELGNSLPGDNNIFIDYIDGETERFLYEVKELLDGYVNSKGRMQKDILFRQAKEERRVEWLPSLDCTVHESTTNLLYFHKVLLSSYFGALKLALYGNVLTSTADAEALHETQDYIVRCSLGTLQDLQVIADTARELQEDAIRSHRHIRTSALQAAMGRSDTTRFSCEIFMINNIAFLEENYKREPCFTLRSTTVPPPPARESATAADQGRAKKKKKDANVVEVFIVEETLQYLRDEKERATDDFVVSWANCFPPPSEDPDLAAIDRNPENALRKSQRMAAKQWHKKVTQLLTEKIRDCNAMAVMDSTSRMHLIDGSVDSLRECFAMMDDVLLGREWSTHVKKWMPFTLEEWIDKVRHIF